jgi:hypothetical protein
MTAVLLKQHDDPFLPSFFEVLVEAHHSVAEA